MFIGEFLCLGVYSWAFWSDRRKAKREVQTGVITQGGFVQETLLAQREGAEDDNRKALTGFANLLLWIPALLDMTGTALMMTGFAQGVAASVYQMLRGAVVLFIGVASVMFLGRRLPLYKWIVLCLVFFGVLFVGLSAVLFPDPEEEMSLGGGGLFGLILIILAQIVAAGQNVVEEKIVSKYKAAPLKCVGLEGAFGLISVVLFLVVFYFSFGNQRKGSMFDMISGFRQSFVENETILYTDLVLIFTIAILNFTGMTITYLVSATSRATVDTCRTILVWVVSLGLGWEKFRAEAFPIQLVGFFVLAFGTFVFNDAVRIPKWLKREEQESYDQTNKIKKGGDSPQTSSKNFAPYRKSDYFTVPANAQLCHDLQPIPISSSDDEGSLEMERKMEVFIKGGKQSSMD
uniref:EamA domain-containing protein n=1 Tax=Chromera velia CCMP2878 TaxID=1169474 RepID=A0A0G4HTK9_9ALVE|eukprot:Cvel_1341.t1-p1 / transcript=Cvel_1341.t1 / gene=Cvel_1341 / organism=Chromera_velia_CCMP2878 / gene_product=Solute carrier family 35 member F6, putative / transcript_product=Solute carrier family 35 member F6, putative / location=Cvel_scaffold46:27967-29175(+) / protein_length=403 / sequence_SO=supercontig / SO=protein_coding / is_pseudo=false